MRILYLTDRLSLRGGADQHLLQVIADTAATDVEVEVAYGRRDPEAALPAGVHEVRVKGLASSVASTARLAGLDDLLREADVVHIQNVMNPVPLRRATATGRAVVTVQDHRVFCPGQGKTLPAGRRCGERMSDRACSECLPDDGYRAQTLALTSARLEAIGGARRLLVLSRYLADEVEAAGLPRPVVLPPWVAVPSDPPVVGEGFILGGRLVAHKGVLGAHRAWRAAGSGHSLSIAGAGPLEDSLEGARRLGWLPPADLRRALHGARALLFPSTWQEPFGMLGVEALAEGTPVVVAESGGTSDWSDAGCITVPAGDIDAMATAIRRLSIDTDLAHDLGLAGKAMVAARYPRGAIAPQMRDLYREVAAGALATP